MSPEKRAASHPLEPRRASWCPLCNEHEFRHSERCTAIVFADGEARRCLKSKRSCKGNHVYRGLIVPDSQAETMQ